jgi:hypothetical protein
VTRLRACHRFNFSNSQSQTCVIDPAARSARVVHESFAQENRGRRESRVPVAPAASRAKKTKHTSVVTARSTGITRHSLHNGFNGLLRALPGDRACLSPSLAEPCKLDAGVEASGPHDLAVRVLALSSAAPSASTASRPASVTIARAPLCGAGRGELVEMICPTGIAKYFCKWGWTEIQQID